MIHSFFTKKNGTEEIDGNDDDALFVGNSCNMDSAVAQLDVLNEIYKSFDLDTI